jgi:two-component sensor histidine kinase
MIGYFGYGIPSDTMLELSQPAAGTLTYALSAACIIWGADHYRTLVQRLAAEEQLRKLTVQELAHRLKNKVATIQAIVSLKLRDHPDVRSELDAALTALAVADDLILSSENRGADLKSLLYAELKPYELSRVSLAGPAVMLPSKLASTLALVFHELTTNAAKYGALSFPEGSIGIRWDTNSGGLDLEWCEPDVQVRTADRQGFGSRLLAVALIPFGGQIERQVDGCGLRYRISLPKLQEQPR